MSSLNIALFVFRYPCFSVHFCSAITLSFLIRLLSIIPGESNHVSYMTNKSSCSILYTTLGHLCVGLTVQGLYSMSDLQPNPIIVTSIIYLCLPSFYQFLVTLVMHWRIYCLSYHSMVPFQHFLMTKTQSFHDGTSGVTFIIGEFLCFSC